jgi:excisionase family DNA binding protein
LVRARKGSNIMSKASAPTGSKVNVTDPFLDVAETAVFLNQTERWVRRQVNEGKIRFTRMGLHLRFRQSWLDEYVETHTVTPEGE